MARRNARIAAMQLIFENLAGGEGGDESLQMVYDELREENKLDKDEPNAEERRWIETVYEGVLTHLDEVDAAIGQVSRNWTVERMPKVDLTILRLGAWEILYETKVPGSVAINEAVEMAKLYSDPASGNFINGVLGTILRRKEAEAAKEAQAGQAGKEAPAT